MIANAKAIALRAWSKWGLYVVGTFSFLDAVLPYLVDYKPFATPVFSAGVTAVSALAAFLRLLSQPELHQADLAVRR